MMWGKFIFLLVFQFAHAWYEVRIDSILAFIAKRDGRRDQIENDLMHRYQMPYRITAIVFPALWLWGVSWMAVFGIIFFSAYFWILFDVLANITWLNQKWWYLGSTSKVDSFWSVGVNWVIKLLVLFGSIYAMYSLSIGRDIIWEWVKSLFL